MIDGYEVKRKFSNVKDIRKTGRLNNLKTMGKYLGVKLIEAMPGYEDGYLVKYEDGYEYWSPKDVFEKAYRKIDGLTFGLAIEALKLGKCLSRDGWNGSNQYIYLSNGYTVPIKDVREERATSKYNNTGWVDFNSHIDIKLKDGSIGIGWTASQADMLAEDWIIIE